MKRFFNILFLSIMLMASINPVFAKDAKFIQITDLHFTTSDESVANFENAIKKINKTKDVDFVVFTGDNIASANILYLEKFVKLVRKIKVPYYIVLGNTDCFKSAGLTKEEYLKILNHHKLFNRQKSFNFTVKDGKYVYAFVDGAKEFVPAANGYFRETTILWLDRVLKKNKKKTVIIFQHFPLFEISPYSASNLYRGDLYNEMLKEHNNVLAVFAGHYQVNIDKIAPNGTTEYIVTEPAQEGYSKYREVYIIDLGDKKFEIYSQIVKF